MNVRKAKHGWILTAVFTVISLMYVYPIVLVFINSFKKKAYISKEPFALPADKMFVGLENYLRGIQQTDLIKAFGWSVFITVFSVAAIILFCSMCAWYISRVNTKVTRTIYVLCLFAMVVPFQMEMYTLYAPYGQSMGNYRNISGLWRRTLRLHVYRIYEVDPPGD